MYPDNKSEQKKLYKYDAFISYRHVEPDKTIAERLHAMLENYKPPKELLKHTGESWLGKLFMDRKELPASSNLSDDIHEALEQSRFLIVICSTRTPESEWVAKEVSTFMEMRGPDSIMTLLIDGEPQEAFPAQLLSTTRKRMLTDGTMVEELLEYMAADIRTEEMKSRTAVCRYGTNLQKDYELYKASIKILKTEKFRLLAPMLDCSFDALRQRQRERALKRTIFYIGATLLVSLIFGIYVFRQSVVVAQMNNLLEKQVSETEKEKLRAEANERDARDKAEQARAYAKEAEKNAERAAKSEAAALESLREANERKNEVLRNQSTYLADLSRQQLKNGDRILSMLLALEALPKDLDNPERPFVREAFGALANAVNSVGNGATILKHRQELMDANFSPDGRYIATSARDCTAQIWDAHTGKLLADLSYPAVVYKIEFSSDGKKLLVAHYMGISVLDAETKKQLVSFAYNGFTAQFSPDSKRIIADRFIYDAATGKRLLALENAEDTHSESYFSTDGKKVIRATRSYTVKCWNSDTGKLLHEFKGHTAYISDIMFSQDGKRMISASEDKTARIWDVATGKELVLLQHENNVLSAAISPDGKYAVTAGTGNSSYKWDAKTGKLLNSNKGYYARISPNGKYIVTAANENKINIWRMDWENSRFILEGHTDYITDIRFSKDGGRFVTLSKDNTARIWDTDVSRDALRIEEHKGSPQDAAFSNDKRMVALPSSDKLVYIFDMQKGREVTRLAGHQNTVHFARFTPDDRKVVTYSSDKTLRVWDSKTGKEQNRFTCEGGFEGIEFIKDNELGDNKLMLITQQFVQLLDLKNGRTLWKIKNTSDFGRSYWVNRDKSYIGVQNGSQVWIYDTCSGKLVRKLGDGKKRLLGICFSTDSKYVAAWTRDNTVCVWDWDTGKQIICMDEFSNDVDTVAFVPYKYQIVTSSNSRILLWDALTGEMLDFISNTLGTGRFEFSEDCRSLIFDSHVFDLETRKEVMELSWIPPQPGFGFRAAPPPGMKYTSDLSYVLSGDYDYDAVIFNYSMNYVFSKAHTLLDGRELTREERREFFLD